MDIISASPSSPPYSLPRNWIHNVFPSFHGPDVRTAFLSHFLKECKSKGIDPFIDNEITRGEFIGPELKKAIQGSRIAIVMLSKRYASSSWCLDELVEIMKCNEDLGYTVIVIFYEVDPTDVKKQIGEFGKVFEETCQGKKEEVTRRWSQALAEVATIAGYHSSKWDKEAEMIEKIVTDVSKMLNNSTSRDFEYLVGMETHMENMRPLLRLDLDEVRMIGIWGTPGIGKTTIAKFLFNQHSKDFQLSVFMANIKRTCTIPDFSDDNDAKLLLQQKFLSQILKEKDIEVPHLGVAQDRLKDKRVLVVLDDVDQLVQLEAMAKETGWFGRGSRIIITTQDQKLLKDHGINHIYEVPFPPSNEALQMFCTYAFGQNSPKDGFRELALEVTSLVDSLPLGLQVMGSYFKELSEQDWSMELRRFKDSLDKRIGSILRFSYDALRREDRELFIHIACFFNNEYKNKVVGHLEKSFSGVSRGLDVLVEKSLVSIDQEKKRIGMHSLLVQLGKEIVHKQSDREPGKRQFLVDGKDIVEVLTDPTAITRSVRGLDFSEDLNKDIFLNISEKAFQRMHNLQFLRLNGGFGQTNMASLSECLKDVSPKLQLLDWKYSPMTCLPFIVNLEFLVELNMPHSNLKKLWRGNKHLRSLKWMNLSYSKSLEELPNFSIATNPEEFVLCGWSSLVELHSSIGNAINLQELDLSGCSSLMELPFSIGNATNLQTLYLIECSNLVELPSSIGNAINLQELDLSGCSSLIELPFSIGNATNLQKLYLCGCLSLVNLPSSIGNAINLQKLDLSGCFRLRELPFSIGNATNLQKLYLCGCLSLVNLPSSIGNAINLQKLDLSGCSSLRELPFSIRNATNLQTLYLIECSDLVQLPSSIGNAVNLQELDLSGCSSLMELPFSIGNATKLQKLHLCECLSLVNLPSSIGNLINLQDMDLFGCFRVKKLPFSIGNATNLQRLCLSECSSLVQLPSSIGNAVNLQELDLSGCSSLVKLHSSIGNAINLQKLDLDGYSPLVKLPPSIGNATNLQTLNLSGCSSLVGLPPWIGNATNLQTLNLSGCSRLVELPPSIGNATNLQTLGLTGCSRLVELPPWIGNATNLQTLDLSGCSRLVELPPSIGNATNLQTLYLSGCSRLVELPPSIGNATNLQTLYLIGCSSLVELPPSIGNATNLQTLYLIACSSLVELPSSIGNAINLQTLDLSGCSSLVQLPSSIGNLINLQTLDLSGCSSLVQLPSSIGNLINLKQLNLTSCSSMVVLPSSIENATNLQDLRLSGCSSMMELPSSIRNATNDCILDFSRCSSLVELPSWIMNATKLQILNLCGCSSLVKLPSSIGNATKLQELNLRGCSSLVELPSSIRNATNLQKLDLKECSSLVELPSSIANATKLQYLILDGCSSLVKLPSSIWNVINHRTLDLSRCSNLVELPSSIGNATNLQYLYLDGCSSLVKLPSSVGNATNLQKLNLSRCSSLVELPSSIGNATNLQELTLMGCSNLVELPSSIGNATNLQYLNLDGCSNLVKLPSSIGNAKYLTDLYFTECSSLVELPSSIGNLQRLSWLILEKCSKLEVLPTNINLESLNILNLTNCASLKSFPEISTNIRVLKLSGTAVEEVPSSIRSWSRLEELHMSYSENLKESLHAFDRITELHLTDTSIQELSPWVKEFSRLHRLVLNGMQNLVSLPQLPDTLKFLDAENCVSLERLDCSFSYPDIVLNFRNCFKLNQEARDLIIHRSTGLRKYSVLPGGEVPACFTYRAFGNSVTVNLNEKPLCTTIKFKACLLLVSKIEDEGKWLAVEYRITPKQTSRISLGPFLTPALSEQLHIFEVEAKKVTSTELVFEFNFESYDDTGSGTWEIKECGLLKLLELQGDEDSDSSEEDFEFSDEEIPALTWRSSKQRQLQGDEDSDSSEEDSESSDEEIPALTSRSSKRRRVESEMTSSEYPEICEYSISPLCVSFSVRQLSLLRLRLFFELMFLHVVLDCRECPLSVFIKTLIAIYAGKLLRLVNVWMEFAAKRG